MNRKGFTLIELLVVMAILGILASITLPRIPLITDTTRQIVCDLNVNTLNQQIELLAFKNNGDYPNYLSYVILDLDQFPSGPLICPAGGVYTMDLETHRVACNHVFP